MRKITVNKENRVKERDTFYNYCASIGRAGLLLRSDLQQHVRMAAEECGFQYLRFHGLLQEDMGVYREDGQGIPIYSWQYVDAVYDFLLDIGIRPFVVFDFMPEKMSSGSTKIFWESANVTPPKDYAKWSELIYNVVSHFTGRYGKEEVCQWFFEVWNEPDNQPFFTGTREEYLKLYDCTARAVKKVCAGYKVGGPAIAGNNQWISALIEYCCVNEVPLDFITSHTYSTKEAPAALAEDSEDGPAKENPIPSWNPGPSWPMGNVAYNEEGVEEGVKNALKAVKESAMPGLEVYFTEWGLTWDYWDPLRDSYQAPSFILSRLSCVQGIQCLSYCEISDVFEEDGPATGNFHGGFGLINLQGIRKPAYFAYRFLALLGETRLFCSDSNAFACSKGKDVQVLFWDCTVRQDRENKKYYCRDIPPLDLGQTEVIISGLEEGKYKASIYCVGYRKNDAYTLYLNMEEPAGSLSREQVACLKTQSEGKPISQIDIGLEKEDGGTCRVQVDMRENDVFLVTLEAINN